MSKLELLPAVDVRDGQAVRLKYRPGTARSEALQSLRRQVALARL